MKKHSGFEKLIFFENLTKKTTMIGSG
jgi:hypothetical protein